MAALPPLTSLIHQLLLVRLSPVGKTKFLSASAISPVATALNRLDVGLLIHAFGRRPRGAPELIEDALIRVWTSTLYPGASAVRADL
jgi:hypothetical protein